MKAELAKTAGYCFGVRRAVALAFGAEGKYMTLGPIIHNRHVVESLREKGVGMAGSLDELPPDTGVIIRSHGVAKAVMDEIARRGIPFIDATCPDVKRIHAIAARESGEGRTVVIIGSHDHPEVQAIAGWCSSEPVILQSPREAELLLANCAGARDTPLSVVSQTTNTREDWKNCCEIIKKECTNVKMFDTICDATCKRQSEAAELSAKCGLMVVVGDRGSSNTGKLLDICRANCNRVIFAENAAEIDLSGIDPAVTVGITAGASTPGWIIKEVFDKMSNESIDMNLEVAEVQPEPVAEEAADAAAEYTEPAEEDFATLLESAIKTLNTGDKIKGVVTGITATEVYVDLGTKHAGYIPVSELSDDPGMKVEDVVKVGDEIECYAVRVNDVEGTAMLSKKRLDAVKSWDDIERACDDHTIVEGTVKEENKGGVVAYVRGIRVFIPASQTGVPKGSPMSEIMGKKVRMRITEVNKARRRVVGSIRTVSNEDRRTAADKIWGNIEVGKIYKGKVKSMTSYGAFVDIGGIDGMVHVSELSWSRLRNPSEVLSVGQEIEVNVLSYDPEKKKISLGYPGKGANPWGRFTSAYSEGSVLEVRIVKLMPFGAFAEVMPGVDGLIHISQIADRRIVKPDDVIAVGDVVKVKITNIDNENKKISLSVRALIEDERRAEEKAAVASAGVPDVIVASSDGDATIVPPEE